jgi:hypothetical protein
MQLLDSRMTDGTRHFGSLPEGNDPESPDWDRFRDHVARLDGARLTSYVTDEVCEAWIDFEWRGHAFQLNNQHGEWWLFVADPVCPDAVLEGVLAHFEAVATSDDRDL